jgi:hypothetical protein
MQSHLEGVRVQAPATVIFGFDGTQADESGKQHQEQAVAVCAGLPWPRLELID